MPRVLFLALAAAAACSCGGSAPPDTSTADDDEGAVTVRVVSRNSRDVVVYLYTGSRVADEPEDSRRRPAQGFQRFPTAKRKTTNLAARQRLGLASGNATTEFKLPWRR